MKGSIPARIAARDKLALHLKRNTGIDLLGWDDDSSPFWLNLNGAELNRLVCEEFPFYVQGLFLKIQ
jgi:hypothetical protein